jgi:hypothetical protein
MIRREETGWSNPKILTIFVLIFVCGAAFGAAGAREFLHWRMDHFTTVASAATPMSTLDELSLQLHLTPDQRQVVMQVLDEYAKYYENLETDRQNVAEHGKRQILAALKPEQQKLFLRSFRYPALPNRNSTGQ